MLVQISFVLRCSCYFHVEFPPETEDDLYKSYNMAEQMLLRTAENETNDATEQQKDEVKFNTKKRKATNGPGKKDKVCVLLLEYCKLVNEYVGCVSQQMIIYPRSLLFSFSCTSRNLS